MTEIWQRFLQICAVKGHLQFVDRSALLIQFIATRIRTRSRTRSTLCCCFLIIIVIITIITITVITADAIAHEFLIFFVGDGGVVGLLVGVMVGGLRAGGGLLLLAVAAFVPLHAQAHLKGGVGKDVLQEISRYFVDWCIAYY